ALPGMIVPAYNTAGDPLGKRGYIVMSLLFGGVFALCLLVTALFARETIQTPPRRDKFSLSDFIRPLKLPAFRQYMGMQMCLSFAMAIMSSLFFMYINFYLRANLYAANGGDAGMLGLISAALMFAMQIVALPFYLWFIGKTSKAAAYRLGSVIWIVTALVMLAVTPSAPDWVVYLMAALMGFGISGAGLTPHTMFGDVNDAGEVAFGVRTEGAFGGLMNFINKVAQAVGIALVFAALGLTGFVEQVEGEVLVLSQPPAAQLALKLTLCLAPLVFMGVGIWISTRYKINREKQAELAETIRLRKEQS
ncbi:MAG: MFS transporter, partial [Oscillospiraceae bacterium]|nr:MFS transporter [Oscillospiraceae bacterium]